MATDKELLDLVLEEEELPDEQREAFTDMRQKLGSGKLSEKQRAFVRGVLGDKAEPEYENLVSSGKVSVGNHVETPAILRRENLPLRPPARRMTE